MNDKTKVIFENSDIQIGFHIAKSKSKVKPLFKSFETQKDNPLRSYQIYIANARSSAAAKIDTDDILEARKILKRYDKYACIHGKLTYNLAGSVDGTSDTAFKGKLESHRKNLINELDVGTGFGAGVVVHIGSCKDKDLGINTIAKSIDVALSRVTEDTKKIAKAQGISVEEFVGQRKLILENAAGEGNKIGSTLDEISKIIKKVDEKYLPQVKVCIDTAHIFGAGQYDFGNEKQVVKFFKDFDKKIGVDKLELFHLNDSRVPWKSKKDRHENLGLGYIFGERESSEDDDLLLGMKGLKKLIDEAEKRKIPLIGEPPQRTIDGYDAPGGIWDYAVINEICDLEFVCE